ncbi:MAG: NAD(+) synthase [Kiritimatiellae bacterium]|nr:NAD(+) synthase [Kiritimatiellia bacterium]
MIKSLNPNGGSARIAIAQIASDQTDPAAIEAGRADAVARARADGADIVAIGGESGLVDNASVTVATDDSVFNGDAAATLARFSRQATATGRPVVLAGTSGVRDGGKAIRVFNGLSGVFLPDGTFRQVLPRFEEGYAVVDISGAGLPPPAPMEDTFADKARALRFGLRAFMARLSISRVAIGISGGIDSAVASALYASLLPPEDILLLAMPGPFTSQTTRRLARELAENLGCRFAEIPIGEAVDLTCRQFAELRSEGPGGGIAGAWELSPFAIENVQARDRGSRVLAAAASALGGVVSCNANKAEATIGYGTLHGDIFGWLSCLGDLWKGEVYALGRFLNDEILRCQAIPEGIFSIKPSAELSAAQDVERGLGDPLDYPYHDKLFRAWVEDDFTPADCIRFYGDGSLPRRIGYDGDLKALFPTQGDFEADVRRWWRLYRGLAVAKRLQAPPVIALSRRAFGEFTEIQGRRD